MRRRRPGYAVVALVLGAACAAASGCATVRDVTARTTVYGQYVWQKWPEPWPGYTRDGVYALKRDLFYGKLFYRVPDDDEIFPPWAEPGAEPFGHYSIWDSKALRTVEVHPSSIEEYKSDPARWVHIKGVVPKGTRLRIDRVLFWKTFESSAFYYIGVFLDGPFAGKSVLLNAISTRGHGETQSYRPDCLDPV